MFNGLKAISLVLSENLTLFCRTHLLEYKPERLTEPFLLKALEVGNCVYSLHNHPETDKELIKKLKASNSFLEVSPSPFLERFVSQHNGVVRCVYAMLMTIPKMFDFHTKLKHDFVVDLYVIKRLNDK